MGTGRRARIPVWIPILVIALTHYKVQAEFYDQQSQYDQQYSDQQYDDQQSNYDYPSVQQTHDISTSSPNIPHVTIIPPVRTTLTVKPGNPAHNGRVCSTWGNFHFKTFDGDIYYFPGLCNYVFASHCKAAYEDFNIQIRRAIVQNATVISHIGLKLDGTDIELTPNSIVVNGELVQLPYSHSGILAERSSGYLKVSTKLGVVLMWNQEDGLLLELSEKYANQTCGLCGDFNGIPTYNEFVTNNIMLNPVQFGNMQKMDGPTEQCQDPVPSAASNCSHELSTICQTILTGEAFIGCNSLVGAQDYIDACTQDLCQCDKSVTESCICNTFAEYSRQCAHAGGQPLEWRTAVLCTKQCPFNMQHRECGSACANTCTNPERSQLCEDHCTDGCFCPPGTVFDDINNSGCVPLQDCHCTYNGATYSPGASFASKCTSCTCTGGQWTCVDLACPGICSIEGGSHISTFDEKQYSFFGDCSYVLTKLCDSNAFTVLGEIRKCGLTDTETCLKGIAISIGGGQTVVVIKPTGVVFVNMILTQLPFSAANITIFRPSSFFIIVQTNLNVQLVIQLVPIMQLFVHLDPVHKGQTCGLCGNFNSVQADDFKAISGVVEGTSAAFANTWKTQADCPNVKNIFENPCTLSIENAKYQICPKTLVYRYNIDSCQATCRSLSEPDVTCSIKFTSVDGCTCEEGTYLDETGKCVPPTSCPCYYKGSPLPSGEVVHENGVICTCTQGKLQCMGVKPQPVCDAPMIYFDCSNITGDATGAECQKSCQTLDMGCYSTQCVSGCTCPNELVSDGNGGCIAAEECPCVHNEATFKPGETIKVKCNTCTCKNRKWECTNNPCMATCSVYGDGHYITFDGKRYSFSGDCEYTLVQDHCNKNSTNEGSFRVITENIPCGTTGTTCSKAIKVFLKNYELILTDGKFEVIQRAPGGEVPYKVRYMGIYMVIDTTAGLVLLWDKKTSIFIKLGPEYEGDVCGLCGNFDGNDLNDFTTRSLSVVGDVLEFGNSWKVSPTCPDAKNNRDPCSANPYRNSWAQKQCSIINSQVFAACHSQVEPTKYYEACVSDACACDTGGDCECFCTAVAAYAQACNEAGVCVAWRTPSICRCYPKCPASKPYFDEDDMECVDYCHMCYDDKGKYYKPGTKIPSEQNCQSCTCTTEGKIECGYDKDECYCIYEGKKVKAGEIVYNTTDGIGGCITAICTNNGTIERNIFSCSTTTTTTFPPFTFSTSPPPPTTTVPITTTPCVQEECRWSQWLDASKPGSGSDGGDFDTFDNLRAEGETIYNKTDSDGCQFYAICSQTCTVERFAVPCRTTPEPTSPVKTTTPITTTPTTPMPGCPDAMPPRKTGETWISNCTKSTCEGNNKIVISQVMCPPVQKLRCENGYPPVKVFSDDGCCYHYECECVCSGWGDPHYITFDGTYYTFLDNCTYVLVQQITPQYDNFRVDIDNYFCDAEDGLSCPQSIIIYYKSSKLVLTRERYNGVEANKVLFNGEIVSPGFEKDGIFVFMLGINMVAEIPEIGATITFSGLIFSIKLPYSKFGGNTEGQCGTCTNNRKDECRLPSGEITDCPSMAPHWRVKDEKQQYCFPQNITVTPTPKTPCKATPLCEKIMSESFQHSGPGITEGCFCPEGSKLFNAHSEICVSECACIGPDGLPRAPGAVIPRGLCESCRCSLEENPETKLNTVECVTQACDTKCPAGYAYKEKSGQCCGECFPVACVLKLSPIDVHVIKPGETLHLPGNNCTHYQCDSVEDQFVLVTVKRSCPPVDTTNCSPEEIITTDDGCCKKCRQTQKDCIPTPISKVFRHNGCSSSSPVEITSCSGNCNSFSKYSLEANTIDHICNCCQELQTSKRQVTLICPDGSTQDYSYIYVEECGCVSSQCGVQPSPTPEEQQQEEQEQDEQQQQQQQGQD
ncbi:hypothetical protein lerEdw1_005192 [Lerista edwardsae]|nr:hypothetical protein lerEdw1_005192 [Lerista edwardsae]